MATITTESWFIPIDILVLICIIFAVIFSLVFLFVIILDKTCHTVPMLLIANTYLSTAIFASIRLGAIAFLFNNDLKQIVYQDSLCIFRAYIADGMCAVVNYSFLLQAIYRYVTATYPNRLFYQSVRLQLFLICITWIVGLIYPLEFLLRNEIIYNIDNQICQLPLGFTFSMIYMALCIYIIPISLIILIYFKLVRFVKNMRKRVTPVNILSRAQKELKMLQRIVTLVVILVTLGFPYTLFLLISFFTNPPKYHFRIALVFLDVSLLFVVIVLFQFNDSLKISLTKRFKKRSNVIIATMT